MTADSPQGLSSAADVPRRLAEILGGPPELRPGVRHLASVDLERRVMRITPTTPRSELDFFLLNAARASAEAIVTTGRILREEPQVEHALQGPLSTVDELASWRSGELRLPGPPLLVVLSRGGSEGVDFAHPAWHAGLPGLLAVPPEAVAPLESRAPRGVDVVALRRPGLRGVISLLRERGLDQILIEAGPSTTSVLYEDPAAIGELWLSQFRGNVPEEVRGDRFVSEERVAEPLPRSTHAEHEQPSGIWRFGLHQPLAPAT